jgi:hypothetical protein
VGSVAVQQAALRRSRSPAFMIQIHLRTKNIKPST